MSLMEQINALGADLISAVEDEALADLARLALRTSGREADQILADALAKLAGEYRLHDEDRRVRDMLDYFTPPPDLAEIPVAPGRGPMHRVPNYMLLPGGSRAQQGAHWRRMDQLSIMCRHAWERHRAKCGADVPFIAPFSLGQISMGQHYQGLIERHDAAGMKCASIEGRAAASSGGNGGGFIEAYLSEGYEIEALRRKIGDGIALPVKRGTGRRPISDRALVDAVCLAGKDLTTVLRNHGWANDARIRDKLRHALSQVLDRMIGHRPEGGGKVRSRADRIDLSVVVPDLPAEGRIRKETLSVPKKGD